MAGQRKRYSVETKAKVAGEAIKGQKTSNEIAAEYGVHPSQIAQWKKQALDELPHVFSARATQRAKTDEALIASLYQQIGQLKVELDWLQKKRVHGGETEVDGALQIATPEIFNSDQGVQFTRDEFTSRLKAAEIRISWDGRGRALDNIFVERFWRSVTYEEVYLKDYQSVPEAVSNLRTYFTFDNQERLHQALDYQTPAQVYMKQ